MVHAGPNLCRSAVASSAHGRLAAQTEDQGHVHSDQGPQFTGHEGQEFLEHHNLAPGMSRRRSCWDNAVAESFFNLLKRERIRRRKYKTREEARRDVFDYIEFFYNPQRKHVRNGMLSPIDFEQQQKLKLQGVYKSRGYSDRPVSPLSTGFSAAC